MYVPFAETFLFLIPHQQSPDQRLCHIKVWRLHLLDICTVISIAIPVTWPFFLPLQPHMHPQQNVSYLPARCHGMACLNCNFSCMLWRSKVETNECFRWVDSLLQLTLWRSCISSTNSLRGKGLNGINFLCPIACAWNSETALCAAALSWHWSSIC